MLKCLATSRAPGIDMCAVHFDRPNIFSNIIHINPSLYGFVNTIGIKLSIWYVSSETTINNNMVTFENKF